MRTPEDTDREIADYAEFPIKMIEHHPMRALFCFYLDRPEGRVFPLRVGQQVTFDTWPMWESVCLGGAVGEGWVEIRYIDFNRSGYLDHTLPKVLIRRRQPVREDTRET